MQVYSIAADSKTTAVPNEIEVPETAPTMAVP